MAKIIELIITSMSVGKGTDKDVSREVIELWTKEGQRVILSDPRGDPHIMHSILNELLYP